jgi:hypothetical protein
MRLKYLGFILLFIGFLWLCWNGTKFRTWVTWRQVSVARYASLPKDAATFSRAEMHGQIHDTAAEVAANSPSYVLPGIVMLAGGVILGLRRVTMESNQSLQPTAGRSDASQ